MDSANSHTPAAELHLAYLSTQPDIDDFDVKETGKISIAGAKATTNIIGSSHYIQINDLGVYEILSCRPIDTDNSYTIPLQQENPHQVTREINGIHISVSITPEELELFDPTDNYDMIYKFGEDAYTTINQINEATYETYHTYPEFNLALGSTHEYTIK